MDKIIKYPGSKWGLAKEIIPYIPDHHSYLEPYFGSGAVFFKKEPSRIETINDLDGNVTNLFDCIRTEPERLAAIVMATPYSREMYDRAFKSLEDGGQDRCQRAAAFLTSCWQSHGFRVNKYKVGRNACARCRLKTDRLWKSSGGLIARMCSCIWTHRMSWTPGTENSMRLKCQMPTMQSSWM